MYIKKVLKKSVVSVVNQIKTTFKPACILHFSDIPRKNKTVVRKSVVFTETRINTVFHVTTDFIKKRSKKAWWLDKNFIKLDKTLVI